MSRGITAARLALRRMSFVFETVYFAVEPKSAGPASAARPDPYRRRIYGEVDLQDLVRSILDAAAVVAPDGLEPPPPPGPEPDGLPLDHGAIRPRQS